MTFGDKSKGMLFPLKGCTDYKVHGSFLYINLTISSLLTYLCQNQASPCIELLNTALGWEVPLFSLLASFHLSDIAVPHVTLSL